jgi:hypothetical protein
VCRILDVPDPLKIYFTFTNPGGRRPRHVEGPDAS